ncbi:hypothetical protein BKA57DRAFT_267344 [Linnemannia elongata]|nr:hypothetical protein BKA57DRAFT_267344 [Linnemannia elongata]
MSCLFSYFLTLFQAFVRCTSSYNVPPFSFDSVRSIITCSTHSFAQLRVSPCSPCLIVYLCLTLFFYFSLGCDEAVMRFVWDESRVVKWHQHTLLTGFREREFALCLMEHARWKGSRECTTSKNK